MRRYYPYVQRYWFLAALLLAMGWGGLWPHGGHLIQASGVLPFLVAAVLFISGYNLDASRLWDRAADGHAILLGLSSTYVVAPALAYLMAMLWAPPISGPTSPGALFLQGVMIAAAQAGTIASAIALTMLSRGNQELALVLTLLSNSLTVVLTPLVLQVSIGATVELPLGDMMIRMVLVVLLPVALGQLMRRFLYSTAPPLLVLLRFSPQLIILIFVYCGFAVAAQHLVQEMALALRFFGACASLHFLLLGWTYGSATVLRLSTDTRAAVVFCGSQKTLPNGIFVWQNFFAHNPYGAVPIVLYHVLQLVVDTLLIPRLQTPPPHNRQGMC